jgi:hypothetical protein
MGKMLRTIMAELQHMKFVTKVFRFGQKLRKITLKLILPNKFSHYEKNFFVVIPFNILHSSLAKNSAYFAEHGKLHHSDVPQQQRLGSDRKGFAS